MDFVKIYCHQTNKQLYILNELNDRFRIVFYCFWITYWTLQIVKKKLSIPIYRQKNMHDKTNIEAIKSN